VNSTLITVRQAAEGDIESLQRIGRETYREHFNQLWTAKGIEDFLDQDFSLDALSRTVNSQHKHLWLIALEANDRAIGFAKINWDTPSPTSAVNGAELQKIYFLKSRAGRGYGSKLLSAALNRADRRGVSLVWLDVLRSNLDAQRFYERHGFKRSGETPFKTDLLEIGMVVMEHQLA
jgi:ribosomal protein S18 acetylase RimI-like enzyme